jgi:hypothetical protein
MAAGLRYVLPLLSLVDFHQALCPVHGDVQRRSKRYQNDEAGWMRFDLSKILFSKDF